jgi:putative glycosyl hydrolase
MRNLRRLLLSLVLATPCMAQVQPEFFDLLVDKPFGPESSSPITIPFSSLRLLGRGVAWSQLCRTPSACDWPRLDQWLAAAKRNGVSEVLYTNMKTPPWASSNPTGRCWWHPKGECFPPRDITPDGGGSDSLFKEFIQALVDHNRKLDPHTYAKIKFWGIWNEPNVGVFWKGTQPQLVRIGKDAYSIIKAADPGALIVSPEAASTSGQHALNVAGDWLDRYLAAGGGAYFDVIGFHAGCNTLGEGDHPAAECVIPIIRHIKENVAKYPEAAGKPLWMTEGNWGSSADFKQPSDAGAFLVRYYTLLASQDVRRVYWFEWDGDPNGCCGALWSRQTGELPGAKAYKGVYKWLVGRTVSNCSAQGHIWSCDLTGPGYKAKMVWDDEYEKTASYDPSGFGSSRDISDVVTRLDPKAHAITVGNMPVLLEPSGKTR